MTAQPPDGVVERLARRLNNSAAPGMHLDDPDWGDLPEDVRGYLIGEAGRALRLIASDPEALAWLVRQMPGRIEWGGGPDVHHVLPTTEWRARKGADESPGRYRVWRRWAPAPAPWEEVTE